MNKNSTGRLENTKGVPAGTVSGSVGLTIVNFEKGRPENGFFPTSYLNGLYKIGIIKNCRMASEGKNVFDDVTNIVFFSPAHPFDHTFLLEKSGIICAFDQDFSPAFLIGMIKALPLFNQNKFSFVVNNDLEQKLMNVFLKMRMETNSEYLFKGLLLQNYLKEVFHLVLKTFPAEKI